jgi:hypothetical protein
MQGLHEEAALVTQLHAGGLALQAGSRTKPSSHTQQLSSGTTPGRCLCIANTTQHAMEGLPVQH